MSLKAFHIVFVTASTLLGFSLGAWALDQYFRQDASTIYLASGVGSIIAGIGMIVYGRYFLKKLKNISYL
jgi:hypothetical protein